MMFDYMDHDMTGLLERTQREGRRFTVPQVGALPLWWGPTGKRRHVRIPHRCRREGGVWCTQQAAHGLPALLCIEHRCLALPPPMQVKCYLRQLFCGLALLSNHEVCAMHLVD